MSEGIYFALLPVALSIALVPLAACGDDKGAEGDPRAVQPLTPLQDEPGGSVLSASRYEHCLPVELSGAEVSDAPRVVAETGGRLELEASYVKGAGIVRAVVVLYPAQEAANERSAEDALMRECEPSPECTRHTIGEAAGRVVALAAIAQESANLFVDPGIRVSVLGPRGDSAAFAQLVDLDCLRTLHRERIGPE